MKNISELLNIDRKPMVFKPPPHELAASVDEIIKVVGITPKYGYKYWLGKVKRSNKQYTEILGILKDIQRMDSKYNKGGRLTNILSNKK